MSVKFSLNFHKILNNLKKLCKFWRKLEKSIFGKLTPFRSENLLNKQFIPVVTCEYFGVGEGFGVVKKKRQNIFFFLPTILVGFESGIPWIYSNLKLLYCKVKEESVQQKLQPRWQDVALKHHGLLATRMFKIRQFVSRITLTMFWVSGLASIIQ